MQLPGWCGWLLGYFAWASTSHVWNDVKKSLSLQLFLVQNDTSTEVFFILSNLMYLHSCIWQTLSLRSAAHMFISCIDWEWTLTLLVLLESSQPQKISRSCFSVQRAEREGAGRIQEGRPGHWTQPRERQSWGGGGSSVQTEGGEAAIVPEGPSQGLRALLPHRLSFQTTAGSHYLREPSAAQVKSLLLYSQTKRNTRVIISYDFMMGRWWYDKVASKWGLVTLLYWLFTADVHRAVMSLFSLMP